MQNQGTVENPVLEPPEYLVHKETRSPVAFGHHSCAAEAVEVAGRVKIIVGGEDGQFYLFDRDEFT